MTPPASFTAIFERQRELLQQLAGGAPLTSVEQQNWTEYETLLGNLQARVNYRRVVADFAASDAAFRSVLAPRERRLNDRKHALELAMIRLRASLRSRAIQSTPAIAALNEYYINEVLEAEQRVRKVGGGLSKKLNRILRSERITRVSYEMAHVVLALAVFTFGFEWIGNRMSEWMAGLMAAVQLRTLDEPVSNTSRRALWFVVTVVMFGIERWFLGPAIDDWLEARIARSIGQSMGLYFAERTHLEYVMAIQDHMVAIMEQDLRKHGLL